MLTYGAKRSSRSVSGALGPFLVWVALMIAVAACGGRPLGDRADAAAAVDDAGAAYSVHPGDGNAVAGDALDDHEDGTSRRACVDAQDVGLTIDPAYCVVTSVPLPAAAAAFELRGDRIWWYAAEGAQLLVGALLADGSPDPAHPPLEQTIALEEGTLLFPSSYLTVAAGQSIVVGYTLSDFSGRALVWQPASRPPHSLEAPGNFDALWLDPTTLLVNGNGLDELAEGQGVYLWQRDRAQLLIGELGSYSGYLALGTNVLYAGGAFGTFPALVNRVFAFSLDEVRAAIVENRVLLTSRDGDLVYEGNIADAATLDDDLVVLDSYFDFEQGQTLFDAVTRLQVDRDGDRVEVRAATNIIAAGSGEQLPTALASQGAELAVTITTSDGASSMLFVALR